jgi:hypothetical protein
MQSIKRDLATGLSVSALAFACAIAWGSPFVSSGVKAAQAQEPQQTQPQPQPDQAQPQQQPDQAQPQPDQAPAKTFTGTIMKNGSNFVLRDVSGHVFELDDPDSAKPYVGKSVKVVGQLDEQAMLIHVQSIEGTAA